MDTTIRVESIKATITVTEAKISVITSRGASEFTFALTPLIVVPVSLSLGGCSVTAVPNPATLSKKRGDLAVAI